MADSKKYDGSQWEHSLRKMTTATAEIEPTIYTDGTAITSYTIKGNTVQYGTPTPSNPVEVNGVGNKTANLFDYQTMANGIVGKYLNAGGTTTDDSRFTITDYIPCDTDTVTLYRGSYNNQPSICGYDENKNYITGRAYNSQDPVTLTSNQNFKYVRFSWKNATHSEPDDLSRITLCDGADATHEPYGYKIPISTLQGSAVNYLGSVQSYREIAKYIFDGTDNFTWTKSGTRNFSWFFNPLFLPDRGKEGTPFLCSHGATVTTLSEFVYGTVYADNTYNLGIFPSELSTVTELRQWLATQYANGTPVTIWYSLYTPTTATVNEPLMKIGDYADTLSNATSIPTTEGANSITVDTTVQPSEFTATWSGWHDASVKEKSENLFDYEYYFDNKVNTGGSNDWLAYQLEPNTAYTVSCNVPYVDNLAQMFVSLSNTSPTTANNGVGLNNPRTITTDSTGVLYILSRGATAPSPLVEVTKQLWEQSNWWLMLNSGSTAQTYAPYWI